MSRRALAALAALAVAMVAVISQPAGVRAESLVWTLAASPLATTTGVSTTFTLTATNEDPLAATVSSSRIGCVVVTLPPNFSVASSVVTASNSGDTWHADPLVANRVTIHADSGGDRLRLLGWVRFNVTATANSSGSIAWSARAYESMNCTGTGALLGVPPIVIVTGAPVAPTPAPTPTPSPVPTPRPTPQPSQPGAPTGPALPSLPTLPSVAPIPVLPPAGAPRPSSPAEEPPATPAATRAATPSPTPAPTSRPGQATSASQPPESASPSPGLGDSNPDATIQLAPADPARGGALNLAPLDVFSGATVFAVPAAALGGPGILILVWVALQTLGAATWLPAVRRLRGRDPEASRAGRMTGSTAP